MRFQALIAAGALLAIFCAAILAASTTLGGRASRARAPETTPATNPMTAAPARVSEVTRTLTHVEHAFAAGYAAYLDGAPVDVLRDASITATGQARSGGRIPTPFRDGPLTLASASIASSPLSAQATIVLANREERYPLTVQLLREQHAWKVEQLQPPDLTTDQTIKSVAAVDIPPAARAATRRFAIAYAAYRARVGAFPQGMTRAAVSAVRDREDTLAGDQLPATRPRRVSVAYGPLNEDEFAATATVRLGAGAGVEQTFSLLMQLHPQAGGWLCAAFL